MAKYKDSEDYDNILDIGLDIDFIDGFFTVNGEDMDAARNSLINYYLREFSVNQQKAEEVAENEGIHDERAIAMELNKRNMRLIQYRYNYLMMRKIEKSNSQDNELSIKDNIARRQFYLAALENLLEVELCQKRLIEKVSKRDRSTLFGKERDLDAFKRKAEEEEVKKEEGKDRISVVKAEIETAKSLLETAMSLTDHGFGM